MDDDQHGFRLQLNRDLYEKSFVSLKSTDVTRLREHSI